MSESLWLVAMFGVGATVSRESSVALSNYFWLKQIIVVVFDL